MNEVDIIYCVEVICVYVLKECDRHENIMSNSCCG